MTIASIAALARQRSALAVGPGVAAPPSAPGAGQADVTTLANAVPIDVIVLYTTVIGVLAGVLKDSSVNSYLPLRWGIYFGCIAGICILVPLTYYLQSTGDSAQVAGPPPLPAGQHLAAEQVGAGGPPAPPLLVPRRVPVSETVIAVLAFGVWGLVVPGSPLYVALDPPSLPVTVTTLSAVGVFVLTSIAIPLLKRPARPGRPRPVPQPVAQPMRQPPGQPAGPVPGFP